MSSDTPPGHAPPLNGDVEDPHARYARRGESSTEPQRIPLPAFRVAVVVGNPKPRSRTLEAAVHVARELTGRDPDLVVDLAELGGRLLDPADPEVRRLVADVGDADLVVVASPTYKATYTGLLKLFLDRFATGTGLTGIAVPLMLGGGPTHALAPELSLRPLLSELGAVIPVRALYVVDSRHDRPESYAEWLAVARPVLQHVLTPPLLEGVS